MTVYYVDGAVGSNLNSGLSEGAGNAWATIQHAEDTMAAGGGDVAYVKASAVYAEQVTLAKSFSVSVFPNRIIGYTTTPGDRGRATIDATGFTSGIYDGFVTRNFRIFENLRVTGADNYNVYMDTGDYGLFVNCEFDNSTLSGVRVDNNHMFLYCDFHSNGQNGTLTGVDPLYFRCKFYNNTGSGVGGAHGTMVGCLGYDNASGSSVVNFGVANGNNIVVNNTFEQPGTTAPVLGFYRSYLTHFFDNIFAGGTYGIQPITGSAGHTFHADRNLFFNQVFDGIDQSTQDVVIDHGNNIVGEDPLFTDAAGGDFTIPNASPATGAGSVPGNVS